MVYLQLTFTTCIRLVGRLCWILSFDVLVRVMNRVCTCRTRYYKSESSTKFYCALANASLTVLRSARSATVCHRGSFTSLSRKSGMLVSSSYFSVASPTNNSVAAALWLGSVYGATTKRARNESRVSTLLEDDWKGGHVSLVFRRHEILTYASGGLGGIYRGDCV